MKKYWYIFKAEMMSALQYIGNLLFGSVSYFIIIYILLHLWNYIYEDPSELINGYSKSQMIWYVIITEILWKIFNGRKLCRKICDDVRGGNIAYNMNKPYSYIGYILSSHLGEGIVKAFIYTFIGMGIGFLSLGAVPNITIISALIVLISGILAVMIDALFVIGIGLFSFYMEDANPLYWIYSKMILILGTIFPIEFFPLALQKIVAFSPIYVI